MLLHQNISIGAQNGGCRAFPRLLAQTAARKDLIQWPEILPGSEASPGAWGAKRWGCRAFHDFLHKSWSQRCDSMTEGGAHQILMLLHQNTSIGAQSDGVAELFRDFLHKWLLAEILFNVRGRCASDMDAFAPKHMDWGAKRWACRAFPRLLAQAAGRRYLIQ